MKKLMLTAVLTAAALTGFADTESHTAAAEKLISIVAPAEVYVENFNTIFATQAAQFKRMGIGQEDIDKILAASDTFASKVGADPELTARMVQIYQDAYTEEELIELLAFYETPIGRKMIKMMPRLTQQEAIINQEIALKYQPEFQMQVQAILSGTPASKTEPGTAE